MQLFFVGGDNSSERLRALYAACQRLAGIEAAWRADETEVGPEKTDRVLIIDDLVLAKRLERRQSGVKIILLQQPETGYLKQGRALMNVSGVLATSFDQAAELNSRLGFPKAAIFCLTNLEPETLGGLIGFITALHDRRRCVLVPINDGAIAKNIVDSGALAGLLAQGCRVVLWVDPFKEAYYRQRFGPLGYEIEPRLGGLLPTWLMFIQNFALDCIPTRSILLKHLRRMQSKKKYLLGSFRLLLWSLGHLRWFRRSVQRLILLHSIHPCLVYLMNVFEPSLIFCPTMVSVEEMDLMRLAKRRAIPMVGMVKSWDNITSKLTLPFFPEKLLVQNEIVREEAWNFFRYPKERMVMVGLPQFDRYQESKLMESREAFCARMGLDPAVPFVLYCAAGLWMSPNEPEILKSLDRAIEAGTFGPLKVLVRMHPKYDCGAEQLVGTKHLILDRPGTYVNRDTSTSQYRDLQRWEYDDQDLRHLISSLRHAAVTLNTASTMILEAAYFDRPIILLAYDPKPVSWVGSLMRYYEREHIRPILRAQGTKMVKSEQELLEAVGKYLKDPNLEHAGRERIVREQCLDREPVAAQRVSRVLEGMVQRRPSN